MGEYRGRRNAASFLRYYRAKSRQERDGAVYRLYVATALRLCTEALAGVRMTDYAEAAELRPVDKRTGDEIAADVINKAGLILRGE